MSKQHAKRKSRDNVKTMAKAGKASNDASTLPPGKAPQRTMRQAGGMRASMNRGGKSRVNG